MGNMVKRCLVALALLFLAALPGCTPVPLYVSMPPPAIPAYTTSFVCENGNTPVQNAVCGNAQLAALDVQMAAAYRQHLGDDSIFQRDQVLATQRAWLLSLPSACNLTAPSASVTDPATISCLATTYQSQIATLTQWPSVPASANDENPAIAHYVQYKLLDARQPALCDSLNDGATSAMTSDGSIDPARLDGAQEIAGSHGAALGPDPQGGTITVDLYRAGLYAGYQTRTRGVYFSGSSTSVLDATSVGAYVESLPNGGGRYVAYASQTSDYGDIDVFILNGQLVALVTDTIGYNSPAPPGEAAVAALYTLNRGTAAPACLFETYLIPPPIEISVFSEQTSLSPFISLVASMNGIPSAHLAASDRQDTAYLNSETQWMLFNMPLVVAEQAKAGRWTGWLRSRHDQVLDTLYAWSQKSPANQAEFSKLFALLQPAASDLDAIYVQQQGLTTNDAEQATALAIMELLYQSTITISPGLGSGPADPLRHLSYRPRYPILAEPNPEPTKMASDPTGEQ